MMQTGFIQAKKDHSVSVEEAFEQLKAGYSKKKYEVKVTRQALEQMEAIKYR